MISFVGSVLSKSISLLDGKKRGPIVNRYAKSMFADLVFFELFGFSEYRFFNLSLTNTANSFLQLLLIFSFILGLAFIHLCMQSIGVLYLSQKILLRGLGKGQYVLCTRNCGRSW